MGKKLLLLFWFSINILFGQEWIARYNGPGNSIDEARGIAVHNGSVYVTGYSYGEGTSSDYATIKYDSNGQELWVQRYNGEANGFDWVIKMAVDNYGNVYVTGWSEGEGTDYDYATIKYNSDGQVVWVRRYNGPGNYRDGASAIAVDNHGNAYVTGGSYGNGTFDYATIKYDSNGQVVWIRRYNGEANGDDRASAIAVDNYGNVYVTGYSYGDGTFDYVTIKYDSNGQVVWIKRYNGEANGDDRASAIAVDNYGNVYVTGWSIGLGTAYDYLTIKYNSDGEEVWIRRYNGPGNFWDWVSAIVVDNYGNVYITGYSYGDGTFDYATIKYDSNGQELWVQRYNGPTDGDDDAWAIAVDNYGSVYVTGESYGNGTFDYVTIKYDSNGQVVWIRRYNGEANGDDRARAIAVDNYGNVYVTGVSEGQNTYDDYATIKYLSARIEESKKEKKIKSGDLIKDESLNLKIYNSLGKIITKNLKELKSGVYFLEIEINKKKESRKIIIVK